MNFNKKIEICNIIINNKIILILIIIIFQWLLIQDIVKYKINIIHNKNIMNNNNNNNKYKVNLKKIIHISNI